MTQCVGKPAQLSRLSAAQETYPLSRVSVSEVSSQLTFEHLELFIRSLSFQGKAPELASS